MQMTKELEQTSASMKRMGLMVSVALCMLAVLLTLVLTPGRALAFSPEVVGSEPEDGATAAATDGRMWVKFENNVVAVAENATLVKLETADGQEVSADKYTVSLPDSQTEFDYRQYIWIDVTGLDAGTQYVIHVLPGIEAKNGNVNDTDTKITFTTARNSESAVAFAAPDAVAAGSGNGGGNGSGSGNGSGGAAAVGTSGVSASASSASAASNGSDNASSASATSSSAASNSPSSAGQMASGHEISPMAIGVIIAVCVAIIAVVVVRARRSRSDEDGESRD